MRRLLCPGLIAAAAPLAREEAVLQRLREIVVPVTVRDGKTEKVEVRVRR